MDKQNELAVVDGAVKNEVEDHKKTGVTDAQENEHLVKLSKPYKFEDEGEITSIDLSCLKNATAEVLIKANRVMVSNGDVLTIPENDIRYALFVAAECTGIPYDFYKKLNLADAIKVKREVMIFFNGGE